MKKNDWVTQGTKMCCKHKRCPYTFTKNSNDPKAKAHYIKYCKIQRKVINEANKQHYNKLIAKSNNKIKTMWNITKKETGKLHSVEQVPMLLVDDEKLKDPINLANVFNNFFITITEKLNIQQIEKGDTI
jgi:hypothetical protein